MKLAMSRLGKINLLKNASSQMPQLSFDNIALMPDDTYEQDWILYQGKHMIIMKTSLLSSVWGLMLIMSSARNNKK